LSSKEHTTVHGNTSRLYSLDALRAAMMLLGVVIHTAVTYMPYPSPVKTFTARHTATGFMFVVNFIHIFRMEVFFIVAGYFGALLYHKKGSAYLLTNRFYKILLPLIAALLILYPIMYFATSYSTLAIAGNKDAFDLTIEKFKSGQWLPFRLIHLWFLYDLLIFTFVMICYEIAVKFIPPLQRFVNKWIGLVLQKPVIRILVTSLLFLLGLFFNKEYALHTNVSFWIDWRMIYTYLIFFGGGWFIYNTNSMASFQWKPWPQLILGTALFLLGTYLEYFRNNEPPLLWMQLIYAFCAILLTFGMIAVFLKSFDKHSKLTAYCMDAAYYVYLIHVPFAMLIPGLLTNLELPATIEFLVTFFGTVTLSLISYHFLVRHTAVGRFLNGKLLTIPLLKKVA
jgi:peptidoglycan/LPS O-acetylase OafA/YrhL